MQGGRDMMRSAFAGAMTVLVVAALAAQTPEGWKVRVDRSTSASDPDAAGEVQFMAMGGGFHAVNPAAAIYWNPASTASGAYTVRGTFKLLKPSGHTNYYGVIFGGRDLDGMNQTYLYFLVAQDGTYLVKRRAGDQMPDPNAPAQGRGGRGGRGPMPITEDVVARTPHAAVQQPGSDGTSTNALEVRVGADNVAFVVNGTVVHQMPRAGLETDGIYGIRVNHQLEVLITDFGATK
jgi:hypothetical protein